MADNAFYLLHPSIQQILYKMKWTDLRPIQVDTIHKIFDTDKNLIISAQTAGGKTEAAFLPILSKIAEDKTAGLSAIYVGPLKALINDQFKRLEKLCELADIPVFKWHGDVSSNAKKKFLKNPMGVMLITPESIESIFINHPENASKLFNNVSYIVIDEMHSFIGTERGAHLKSLIYRISRKSNKPIRILGLSATLGDTDIARKWLLPRNPESIDLIKNPTEEKMVQYLIKGYLIEKPKDNPEEDHHLDAIIKDIIHYFYGKTALVFINSRQMLEFYTDYLHRYLDHKGLSDFFRIHHGSLSKTEREDTEDLLKSGKPTVAFCSSTLELGIDVGDVSIVGQIGAPWSVNSLTQRLGRSGRSDDSSSTMVVFIEENLHNSSFIDQLYPDLLRSVAMTELMLEKWCEPPIEDLPHYSTFVQQILSIITERGGATASTLFEDLIQNGTFPSVVKEDFIQILKKLKEFDLIDQDSRGMIFLGLEGEKIVRNFDFYSAFASERELSVVHKGKKVGSVSSVPDIETENFLILAGKRWKIIHIDFKRQEIQVEPSRGGRLPVFFSSSGPDIHTRIRNKMKDILLSDQIPSYLDNQAKEMLKSAQFKAINIGLKNSSFVQDGKDTYWFTWTGSAKHRTLLALGQLFNDLNVEDCRLAIKFVGKTPGEIKNIYHNYLFSMPTANEIAEKFSNRVFEKYDEYLPETIQIKSYAKKQLDVDLIDILKSM